MPEPCWTLCSLESQGNHPAFLVSMSISVKWHSTLLLRTLQGLSLHFGWNLRPSQSHLGSTWSGSTPFPLCPRHTSFCSEPPQTPSPQDLCTGCSVSIPFPCLSPFLHPISMFVSSFRVWNKVPPLLSLKSPLLLLNTCHKLSLYFHSYVHFIYSFSQNVLSICFMPQPPFWTLQNVLVTEGKELVLMELSLWREGQTDKHSVQH